jgi:AraC-like DNA-binding protein
MADEAAQARAGVGGGSYGEGMSPDVEGPTSEAVFRRPPAALRPWVAPYVGYSSSGGRPRLHRGLPSGTLTLVIALDAPLVLDATPDGRSGPHRYDALVGGLHRRPAMVVDPGAQVGVQLALHPLAARQLLGVPAGAMAHEVVHLRDVWGPTADDLVDRLRHSDDWDERFDVLDDALLQRAAHDRPEAAPEVAHAWRRLGSAAPPAVEAVADEVGWSRRHLASRFATEIGLSPRTSARVARFDRARRALAAGQAASLADLAAAHGYADQAHLAREFRELAGCPPSQWLAEEGLESRRYAVA